jgi:cytochrome P450
MANGMRPTLRYPSGIADLTDPDLFLEGHPHIVFRTLREDAPVYWNPEPEGGGFWAITRHADIAQISKQPELFSNSDGHLISFDSVGMKDPYARKAWLRMILAMDPPEHNLHRRLIAPAFNPNVVRRFESGVRDEVCRLLDGVAQRGSCDFVADIATPIPLWTLSELLGIPPEDRDVLVRWSNETMAMLDPDYFQNPDDGQHVFEKMFDYGRRMIARRREQPAEDFLSVMAHARLDGDFLPREILDGYFVLMVLAGNETTRNTIAGGLLALSEFPDARAALLRDPSLIANAVEEMLRYVTAISYMRRTATADTEIRGQRIAKGDKVVMWYGSANFDETVFPNPRVFDITRANAREHLAFGAGQHFCIGAQLARMQIRVAFEELLRRFPDMHAHGAHKYLRSNNVSGLKFLPAAFTPELRPHPVAQP